MDFSGEDEGHVNAPVNPNLPEFLVIPPCLSVGKTVSLHNGSGVRIAEGLVRNLRSNAIVGSAGPLGDSQIFNVIFIKMRQTAVSFLKIPKFRMECYPL